MIVNITVPDKPVSPGEQFTISIDIDPNTSIAGAQFDLTFDPSDVTVDSVQEGNLLNQNGANTYFITRELNNAAGIVKGVAGVTLGSGETVSQPGTFALVTLTAGTFEGTYSLNLSNAIVGSINAQPMPVTTVSNTITIGVNSAPVLDTIGKKSGSEGETLEFIISANDPNGDTLNYTVSNLPMGANFDPETQVFSWTPSYDQSGNYSNIHFEVTDGELTDSEDITIKIRNVRPDLIRPSAKKS